MRIVLLLPMGCLLTFKRVECCDGNFLDTRVKAAMQAACIHPRSARCAHSMACSEICA